MKKWPPGRTVWVKAPFVSRFQAAIRGGRADVGSASPEKAWRPRTTLDDGLASTVAWFDRQRPVVAAQLTGKPAVHDLASPSGKAGR